MYISPFVFCALIIIVFILVVLASMKPSNDQSSTSVLRGIISGAIMGKGKKPTTGGVKETNEFTRVSADPQITALTGGFAGFG